MVMKILFLLFKAVCNRQRTTIKVSEITVKLTQLDCAGRINTSKFKSIQNGLQ